MDDFRWSNAIIDTPHDAINPEINCTPEKLIVDINLNETVNALSEIHVMESPKSCSCEATMATLFRSSKPKYPIQSWLNFESRQRMLLKTNHESLGLIKKFTH